MKVTLSNNQKTLDIESSQVTRLVEAFCAFQEITCHEVILHFIDKKSITTLHANFFNDPTPTDCITFPIDPPTEETDYRILGELFICPKVALEYAINHDGDPYQEVTLYIIHGLLHLLGYRDQTEAEIAEMRHQEARAMKHLENHLLKEPLCV